mgnify:CR=1 FL=1
MSRPKILLLDEPSMGLAPIIVNQIYDLIREIRDSGITVLLVEQNARKALGICDYAYVLENGKINPDKSFCTFVNPGKPIPQKVVELTGINDSMVADAPTPAEAIRQFKEFCGDNILVAHNANSFDMLFIRKAGDKAGWIFPTPILTPCPWRRRCSPGLHNYKLDTINKHLEIQPFNHHRAVDDAMALARIFEVMLSDLKEKDMTTVEAINTGLGGNKEVLKKKYYHLIILVQNQTGLKNLYRIVSAAHTKYFFKKPRVPRSLLNQYREGLLLSPACEAGELYRAVVAGTAHDELLRIARYYRLSGSAASWQQRVHGPQWAGGFHRSHQELQPHHHPAGRRTAYPRGCHR